MVRPVGAIGVFPGSRSPDEDDKASGSYASLETFKNRASWGGSSATAPAAARNAHKKHSDDLLDVSCLMLATMSPDLQAGLINTNAYDMIRQLRDMFQTQARTEHYDATKAFNECKMIKGTSVSDHVMKMKWHLDHLERLGHPVPLQLATDTILNSLSDDYKPFVVNYNMKNMEKSIAELHSMLKTTELNMGTKNKTKDVLMVRDGGVKKKNGHTSISKGKGPVQAVQSAPKKGKGKGKGKKVKPNKSSTENRCFTCNEVGHWRQNCPKHHEAGSYDQLLNNSYKCCRLKAAQIFDRVANIGRDPQMRLLLGISHDTRQKQATQLSAKIEINDSSCNSELTHELVLNHCVRSCWVDMEKYLKRKAPSTSNNTIDINDLPWDPSKRPKMITYHPNQRDEIRRKYLVRGPCQPRSHEFPTKMIGAKPRRFVVSWFDEYQWLEYSVKVDRAYCLPCYLFREQKEKKGTDAFVTDGFNSWSKKDRLKLHEGEVNSIHHMSLKKCEDLVNQNQSIGAALHKQTELMKTEYRMRLNASVEVCRYLLENALPFREEVLKFIMGELGNDVFALLVDESSDVSRKEQMAVVLRFVDKYGIVRGQGYDGASNMSGKFNGLKALILSENESAFYVHCFAHQLQLVVVAVAKKHDGVRDFFDLLALVVTVVNSSCKRKDMLRESHKDRIQEQIGNDEIETGKGLNQEISLVRAGDTRWNSHLRTIMSLIALFQDVINVLEYVEDDGDNGATRLQASGLLSYFKTFEFVFYMHLILTILGLTNSLSQALQRKDQDILEAVDLIRTTKAQLQILRENGFDGVLEKCYSFCDKHNVVKFDMAEGYVNTRNPRKRMNISNKHYYNYDIFNTVLDMQIREFGDRFCEISTDLLQNMAALNPRNSFSHFNKSSLLKLSQMYPCDFDDKERMVLEHELDIYYHSVCNDVRFANVNSITELARLMVETGKHISHPLVYRLLKLTLVLPVATATVERCFSTMKLVKTDLRNRIADDFLNSALICAIEKEAHQKVKNEDVIDRFQKMKTRRGQI
ncbi:hypothetical protein OSB04_001379 [Centaurea solstitialis]|uniref:CCHC-type domain-containing protein n=1 Tax=Centaurea solstitialis TaxID=347529 RepID=A0AA38TYD4_9ASTR|nr:hypothetical protein OSB04_001379 [Centaurea solstitialis]